MSSLSTQPKPSFDPVLHIIRALAITLVVLGHSFAPHTDAAVFRHTKNVIYMFHMPLFFFISGFFGIRYFIVERSTYFPTIVRQFKRLIVVYLFCSVLIVPMKLLLNRFAIRPMDIASVPEDVFIFPMKHPMVILWFLYVLFAIQMLFLTVNLLLKINYRKWLPVAAVMAFLLALHFSSRHLPNHFATNFIAEYAVFFYAGFMASQSPEPISDLLTRHMRTVLAAGIALFAVCYYFRAQPGASILCTIAGITITWTLAVLINERTQHLKTHLHPIGDHGYAIYVYSYFFQVPVRIAVASLPGCPGAVGYAMMFLLGMIGPVLLATYVLKRNFLLRRIALGDWTPAVET